MAIERDNAFHLPLSDDELKLLKLLAEREGLNASDYLRMLIRTMPTSAGAVAVGRRHRRQSGLGQAVRDVRRRRQVVESERRGAQEEDGEVIREIRGQVQRM